MKPHFPPFGNDTVRLRLLQEADLPLTRQWRNQDNVRIWFKDTSVLEPEQHQRWFERYRQKDDDFVFIVEAEGRPVGQAAVYGIDWQVRIGEVGRFLAAPEARGKGFVGAACGHLIRFCRETLRLRSVFLEVKENNERAIDIYARNGFREERRGKGLIRMSCDLERRDAREENSSNATVVK